jgi:hypothetical protein
MASGPTTGRSDVDPSVSRRAALGASAAGFAGITSVLLPVAAAADSHQDPLLAAGSLRLHLDAGLTTSYSGTGTTWTDVSGNGLHATLVGSPTFVSAGAGSYLSFAGTGGTSATGPHAQTPPLGRDLTVWTVEVWARLGDRMGNRVTALVTDVLGTVDGISALNFCIGTVSPGSTLPPIQAGYFTPGSWNLTDGITVSAADGSAPAVDRWHHHVATYDGVTIRQYLDGTEIRSIGCSFTPRSGGVGVRIARRWDDIVDGADANYAKVDVGLVRVHDVAMTAEQIVAAREATKGRYGL